MEAYGKYPTAPWSSQQDQSHPYDHQGQPLAGYQSQYAGGAQQDFHGYQGYQEHQPASTATSSQSGTVIAPLPYTTPQLPVAFAQDQLCLDTKPSNFNQLPLRRIVSNTVHSQKIGIAGTPIHMVPVVNLLYYGWHDQFLRTISHGEPIGLVPCNSTAEAVLLQRLLSKMRQHGIDGAKVDQMATAAWHYHHGTPPPSVRTSASTLMNPLAQDMLDVLLSYLPAPAPAQQDRILHLENKLAKAGIPLTPHKCKSNPKNLPITDSQDNGQPSGSQSQVADTQQPGAPAPLVHTLKPTADKRSLRQDAPLAAQGINKWIKDFRASLPEAQSAQFDLHIDFVTKEWNKLEKRERPDAKQLASDWGLPLSLVTTFSAANCLKLAAVASFKAL